MSKKAANPEPLIGIKPIMPPAPPPPHINKNGDFIKQYQREVGSLRAMLKRLEFSNYQDGSDAPGSYDWYECPICYNAEGTGHTGDCELAKLLGSG